MSDDEICPYLYLYIIDCIEEMKTLEVSVSNI